MRDAEALSDAEAALLAEPVDLAIEEKRRILAASRSLDRGDYLGLLGVSEASTKRELKRAHQRLLADWHPDGFRDRTLGSFAPLVERVFETASETLRTLAARSLGPAGPRRRSSDRYAFPLRMSARCHSWREAATVVAQDISESGMFLVTSAPVERGEHISIVIATRRSGDIELAGRVVSCRPADAARKSERRPGIGVELDPLDDDTRERYCRVLEAARLAAPMPAFEVTPEQKRTRLARGSGSYDRPTAVVGIDLGTSTLSVSAAVGNRVLVLPWTDGTRAVPSVVAFPAGDEHRVGAAAVSHLTGAPGLTVAGVKRYLGRLFTDRNVEAALARAAFGSRPSASGGVELDIGGRAVSPEVVTALLLRAAADTAERHLEIPVDRAVLTVPVGFTPDRVDALVRAAARARLEVVELVDDPTAIALAQQGQPEFGGVLAIFDLGGGSVEVSVVDASAGDLRVLATAGDASLGGDDFDHALAEATAAQLERSHDLDLRAPNGAWQRLVLVAERAKRALSERDDTALILPAVLPAEPLPRDLRVRLTRDTCEQVWTPLIARVIDTATRALARAGLPAPALTGVVMAGGGARIPALRRAIEDRFGAAIGGHAPPELAACLGAGVRAAQIDRCLTQRSLQG